MSTQPAGGDKPATPRKITRRANPFPEGEAAGSTLHLGFLASVPPSPDLEGIERLRAPGERFQLKGDVFYPHAPDGVGRSRLANGAERLLGTPMTSRNWNTLNKLRELAESTSRSR